MEKVSAPSLCGAWVYLPVSVMLRPMAPKRRGRNATGISRQSGANGFRATVQGSLATIMVGQSIGHTLEIHASGVEKLTMMLSPALVLVVLVLDEWERRHG